MRKITQVRLKNFQSHEDTTITFNDYNIIYGKTNSGKSAILRGIKWALYNLPPAEGVDFRRFGTKETIVEVCFDDGRKITRRRTSKENEYILDDNGNKQSFTQFGRGPLKEVLDFHGMYQVNLFGQPQSINIVEQSEPPFFLSNGPTARGKLISRLAGTVLYESALTLARRDASSLNKEVDKKRNQLETTKNEVEKLSYVNDLGDFLKVVEAADARVEKETNDIKSVSGLSSSVSASFDIRCKNEEMAKFSDDAIEAGNTFDSISESNAKLGQANNYKTAMAQHFDTWLKKKEAPCTIAQLDELRDKIDSVSQSENEMLSANNKYTDIKNKYKNWEDKIAILSSNSKYSGKINDMVEVLDESEKLLASIKSSAEHMWDLFLKVARETEKESIYKMQIEKKTKKYKEALLSEGVCPTCGQKITKTVTDSLNI